MVLYIYIYGKFVDAEEFYNGRRIDDYTYTAELLASKLRTKKKLCDIFKQNH